MEVKLSVVIIALNEEKNIGRCLESVKAVADDILVVDSYSTDRTREIAIANGARFIQHTFHSHIDQKNWAVTQARYPYILSVDADEALSEALRESILEIKMDWRCDGYSFNRCTNYCGTWIRHTTWYPSRKLRLWDSRKGSWGGINPHDKYIMEEGATVQRLRGDLLHYSYYSVEEHRLQLERFANIQAIALREKGRRTTLMGAITHTTWRFINDFLLRLGFLHGSKGFTISRLGAREVWLKYDRLRKGRFDNKSASELS